MGDTGLAGLGGDPGPKGDKVSLCDSLKRLSFASVTFVHIWCTSCNIRTGCERRKRL